MKKGMFLTKRVKYIICVLGMVLALLLVVFSIPLWFLHVSRWKYNVEDFPDYQQDFMQVAAFCSAFIQKEEQADPNAYNWLYYARDGLTYPTHRSAIDLELDPELQKSIETIWQAFPDLDAQLDQIRCYADGSVYFVTHNGLYALAYCPVGKPVSVYGDEERSSCVYKKIVDKWYHVVHVSE